MQHHLICKAQSAYLVVVKLQLPGDSVISVVNFVENCSFIMQYGLKVFIGMLLKPHCTSCYSLLGYNTIK